MAARRSNKRKQRNRGRFGVVYKFLSLVIVLVAVAAGCAVFFRVNEITVVGESKYDPQEIIAASGIEQGDNLFLLRRLQIAKQIVAELPYVDDVSIRKAPPDGVVITVTKCTPAAVIQDGEGSWWVVDAKGKLLEQVSSYQQQGLAVVTGLKALLPSAGTKLAVESESAAKLESLTMLLEALTARGMMDKVSSVDLSGTGSILMSYDVRFTVKLPLSTETDFSYKMRILEGVVAQLQPNEAGSIDLTRDNKVYFDPK